MYRQLKKPWDLIGMNLKRRSKKIFSYMQWSLSTDNKLMFIQGRVKHFAQCLTLTCTGGLWSNSWVPAWVQSWALLPDPARRLPGDMRRGGSCAMAFFQQNSSGLRTLVYRKPKPLIAKGCFQWVPGKESFEMVENSFYNTLKMKCWFSIWADYAVFKMVFKPTEVKQPK